MPEILVHEFQVKDQDVDENNHLNNVVYVQWMQDIARMHSDALGCTLDFYRSMNASWVVRSHQIQYKVPALLNEQITAYTWVHDRKKITSKRKYKFVKTSDGTVLATAETTWVFINFETGKPTAIPEEVINAFPLVAPENEP